MWVIHEVGVERRKSSGHATTTIAASVFNYGYVGYTSSTWTQAKSCCDTLRLSSIWNIILRISIRRRPNIISAADIKLIQTIFKLMFSSIIDSSEYLATLMVIVIGIIHSHVISNTSFKIRILYHLRGLAVVSEDAFISDELLLVVVRADDDFGLGVFVGVGDLVA